MEIQTAQFLAHPKLYDDGASVELDLHGATLEQALRMVRNAVSESHRRGRHQIKIIHGHTASHRLHELIRHSGLDDFVSDEWFDEAYCLLSLYQNPHAETKRLSLRDVL